MTKADSTTPLYLDTTQPLEQRVDDLISRMTLDEKIAQTLYESPAIERLGVPEYNWWNECLHGVARAGIATMFPQSIGLAATWNEPLIRAMADVISTEARAKHHEFARQGQRGIYQGLTFWSPNINIFRDPRWGRGQETYGECPYLTARIGVGFCEGLQGNDPKYLKIVATPKHYAVHSGPEADRHRFDAVVTPKDLRETYLPAFEVTVREAKAYSVMGAYNRTNGEPCCGSQTLLQKILRDEWGFEGYVVSDCGAICDFHAHHKITQRPPESAAMAVNNGCELNCGKVYEHLNNAVEEGLITEDAITRAVKRLFMARFKLGMFDPAEQVAYANIPIEVNDCDEHKALALDVARESIVMLKNVDNMLPLSNDVKSIAVIGPNSDTIEVLRGNYYGDASEPITPLEGIRRRFDKAEVTYAKGCHVWEQNRDGFDEAVAVAMDADVVVMCMGGSPEMEGEEGDVANSDGGGDRIHINMPGVQEELLQAVHATGKPIVLLLFGGSPMAFTWADENIPAILLPWYPGQAGGTAIADVLTGDYNPAGRLPMTYPKSMEQLPDFANYAMQGRTYRYMTEEPLYRFGDGMSFATFGYDDLSLSASKICFDGVLKVSVDVTNTSRHDGDEVVQLYITRPASDTYTPVRDLRGFERIAIASGETKTVTFALDAYDLADINSDGKRVLRTGSYHLSVGGCQPGSRMQTTRPANVIETDFSVTGEEKDVPFRGKK